MSVQKVIVQLASLAQQRGIRYDLSPVQTALRLFGLTDIHIPTIQVAGTNGKGSTVWGIASALQAMGYRVGTYTSPHLVSYTERISMNGVPISDSDFEATFKAIAPKIDPLKLTEFEILTVMAMFYFNRVRPDYLILETGLGGRLDATTAIPIDLAVITRIGKDHMAILGHTLSQIAREKAGIIRAGIPVVVGPQRPGILPIIQSRAAALNALVIHAQALPATPQIQVPFQLENWGTVLSVVHHLKGDSGRLILHSLLKNPPQFWGRFTEILSAIGPVVIDGAHNPNGLRQLQLGLRTRYANHPIHLVLGILNTKDARSMLHIAEKITSRLYYCDFEPGHSVPFHHIQAYCTHPIHEVALSEIQNPLHPFSPAPECPQPVRVFTGSLYFIAKLHSHSW